MSNGRSEPTTDQILKRVADSMVDIAVRGGVFDHELSNRMVLSVEKGETTYEVIIEVVDAEVVWERSLSTEEQVALALHKIGHITDMVQALGMQGGQTHTLLHQVAETVRMDD